jgi:hypothetical protein
MGPTDTQLLQIVSTPATTVADVLAHLGNMDAVLPPQDGLKWFNWLYLQVTQAVEGGLGGHWNDPDWLRALDVNFASLYFTALQNDLQGSGPVPRCWKTVFDARDKTHLARIQFALAGINSHINHDLPSAVVTTCQQRGVTPTHGGLQYQDYTAINGVLDNLVETAKHELLKGPLGEDIPGVDKIEDLVAGWSVTAGRETSWTNAEILWTIRSSGFLTQRYLDGLDGVTDLTNRALLTQLF